MVQCGGISGFGDTTRDTAAAESLCAWRSEGTLTRNLFLGPAFYSGGRKPREHACIAGVLGKPAPTGYTQSHHGLGVDFRTFRLLRSLRASVATRWWTRSRSRRTAPSSASARPGRLLASLPRATSRSTWRLGPCRGASPLLGRSPCIAFRDALATAGQRSSLADGLETGGDHWGRVIGSF
jgi:hypothetical protein